MATDEVITFEWTRMDRDTRTLMLPATHGPAWSKCVRIIAKDMNLGPIIEGSPVNRIDDRGGR
eukprot:4929122-Pyramimonas_sp.AAC.1